MLSYREYTQKKNSTEVDHFVIHLLAMVSTQPNNANKTPEQVYNEQVRLAGLTISTTENYATVNLNQMNVNSQDARNEEPPLTPESGKIEGLSIDSSIDVRDEQIDKPVDTTKIRDDRKDRDPIYKDIDKIEEDHAQGIKHSEKKNELKPKDKDNFQAHEKNPHSGGKETIEKERAAESKKDPHYKKTEEIKENKK